MTLTSVPGRGPLDAEVLILGEAPGENEVLRQEPFVGASGWEGHRMMAEAGWFPLVRENRDIAPPFPNIRINNVVPFRPRDNIIDAWFPGSKKAAAEVGAKWINGRWCCKEVEDGLTALGRELSSMPNLKLVLALGGTALWALTGNEGITNWRGSQIKLQNFSVVPVLHPASILRQWNQRWYSVLDYKRALRWKHEEFATPPYRFIVAPDFVRARDTLGYILNRILFQDARVVCDIETRDGHITCIGFAWSELDAICIPLLTSNGPYWSLEHEQELTWLMIKILTHSQGHIIGQNFLYDRQYFAKHYGVRVRCDSDTMFKQHICLPGVTKGLDFISSIHNHFHCFWKEESKNWDPKVGEQQLWVYNCKDAVATFEANVHLSSMVTLFGHDARLADQMDDAEGAFDMMLRGFRVDFEARKNLDAELSRLMQICKKFITEVIGWNIFADTEKEGVSPTKVMKLFYEIFKLPPQYAIGKGKKRLTADAKAVDELLLVADPVYRPILEAIVDYRSLSVLRNTFARAPVDPDGRLRCSFNVAGPETFRWSSSEDAFGFGMNLQNIPRDEDDNEESLWFTLSQRDSADRGRELSSPASH